MFQISDALTAECWMRPRSALACGIVRVISYIMHDGGESAK
jgi:hypothetical protein